MHIYNYIESNNSPWKETKACVQELLVNQIINSNFSTPPPFFCLQYPEYKGFRKSLLLMNLNFRESLILSVK